MPRRRRLAPAKQPSAAYARLWRVVDGAVLSALDAHPEYLTERGRQAARSSIVKRVTGAVLSFAAEAAKGRSGTPGGRKAPGP